MAQTGRKRGKINLNFKEYLQPSKLKTFLRNLPIMLLGAFIAGLAVNLFFLPSTLTMGGISGLGAVIYTLTGLSSVGLWTMLLNIPIFALGYFLVSKRFLINSIIGTFVYSFMVDLSSWLLRLSHWDPDSIYKAMGQDILLASLLGGVIFGLGLGMMLMAGYTTGGTDIIAVLMRKRWQNMSLGMGIWIVDAIVIGISIWAYSETQPDSLRLGLYSTLALLLTSKAVDLVIEGFNFKRTAIIISRESETLAQIIMRDLERGVTGLSGQGMYTKNEQTVLLCVLPQKQIHALKKIVATIDERAFVFVMDTREVLGEGFEAGEIA